MSIRGTVIEKGGLGLMGTGAALFAIPAALGLYHSHPLQPVGEGVNEILFGDKDAVHVVPRTDRYSNAFGILPKAVINTQLKDQFLMSEHRKEAIADLRTTGNSRRGISNVDGAMVFGMYNTRVGRTF